MELESIFRKIDFVNRYKNICEQYNDFGNCMSGSDTKGYKKILERIESTVVYASKDKSFVVKFLIGDFTLMMVLTLHNGLVEVHLNYLKGTHWLMYNRLDGYAVELDSDFNRELYNIPKYTSLEELEEILKEIFSIYEDIKKELESQP